MIPQIVFITIGEAPRKDLQVIYTDYFKTAENVEQIGLFDNLSHEEAEELFAVSEIGEVTLTSRFIDGYQVVMSQKKVERKLQAMIERLEHEGAKVIGLLCTGNFEQLDTKLATLIMAEEVVIPYIKNQYQEQLIGVLTPLLVQIEASRKKWQLSDNQAVFAAASPYNVKEEEFEQAADYFAEQQVQAVVLDCIGYNREMTEILQRRLKGIPIYLSNELFFKHILETYISVE